MPKNAFPFEVRAPFDIRCHLGGRLSEMGYRKMRDYQIKKVHLEKLPEIDRYMYYQCGCFGPSIYLDVYRFRDQAKATLFRMFIPDVK